MRLRSKLGTIRRQILCSFDRRVLPLGDGGPFVSFVFDDFPRTAYTVGGAILKSFGVRGTYYVAMGLMNTSNELGEQFDVEDLRAAAADGHELASHTFSHSSSREVPLAGFQQDVRKGHEAICTIAKLSPTRNFAYPRGEVTLVAKRVLGAELSSCRGIYGGLNGPLIDLNLLRANSLYGGCDRFDRVGRLISENEARRAWLIFYTHDVRPNPSPYGCVPELLESAVRMAVERHARVLPVAEVLACAGNPDDGLVMSSYSVTEKKVDLKTSRPRGPCASQESRI